MFVSQFITLCMYNAQQGNVFDDICYYVILMIMIGLPK